MDTPVRVGILGLGRAGWGMHCGELVTHKAQFQIVAGCDPYAPHRERFADRFPESHTYARIEDLLADDAVELIAVATRSMDHVDHAIAALKSGKHVSLEKPISLDYAGAKRLEHAAAKAKGKLLIRHNRRFEPGFQHIREIVAEGLLGQVFDIRLARTSFSRRNDWQTLKKLGGGQLLNWGPHIVDHALQFLGAPKKPLASIHGWLRRAAAAGDAEDHLKIVLTGASGCVVDITISGAMALPLPVYYIAGTRGTLTCDDVSITLKHLDPAVKLASRKPVTAVIDGFGTPETLPWTEKTFPISPKETGDIWDAVYNTLRKGKPFPIRIEEAVEVMRVISKVKSAYPEFC